jgi:hypothetical protein
MIEKENVMLTLTDINTATNSRDGDIYSDLFKDVYGSRPRSAMFASVEEFDADYEFLVKRLCEKMEQEKEEQRQAIGQFEIRLNEIMFLVSNTDRVNALRILMDAEDCLDDFEFYGYESLEWRLGLPFGYVKGTL